MASCRRRPCFGELRGTERNWGERERWRREGGKERARVRGGAPWGSCSARGQVERGPRRWWCAVRAAAFRRGNGDEGQGWDREVRERGERACGAGCCAGCAVEATGPAHWLAWLPPAGFSFFFFLKPFYFSFLVFKELEKAKVFGEILWN